MTHGSHIKAAPLALALLLAGCGWFAPTATYTGNNRMVTVNPSSLRPTPGGRIAPGTPLRVQLVKLTLPVGTFSGNEKIWRQLDQDALDSETSILLAENGLRAAVAPLERWPGVHKLIDVTGVVNELYVLQTDGRSSADIVTHPNITQQTIAAIDRDRDMHVRYFDRCDNSLRLALARKRDEARLTIQLEPVVQLGTVTLVRGPEETGIVRTSQRREETISTLRLAAPLDATQFLVLAPASPKENKFSVGARFLTNTDQLPPMETVLVFLPLTDQAPLPPGSAASPTPKNTAK